VGTPTAAQTALRLGVNGHIRAEVRGKGGASLAMIEAYQAQCADSLHRLKGCRNTRCTVTFFDHCRNSSHVWHRARKRATADTACLTALLEPARPYSLTNLGQHP
jgi:hypothetical protein